MLKKSAASLGAEAPSSSGLMGLEKPLAIEAEDGHGFYFIK
jgi:hypothetical protein